eukprot:Gb_21428 [translate_table: standard]
MKLKIIFGSKIRRHQQKLQNILELHVISNLATLLALTIGKWFSPDKCTIRSAINRAPSRGGLAIGDGKCNWDDGEHGGGGIEGWGCIVCVKLDEVGCVDLLEDPSWYGGGYGAEEGMLKIAGLGFVGLLGLKNFCTSNPPG